MPCLQLINQQSYSWYAFENGGRGSGAHTNTKHRWERSEPGHEGIIIIIALASSSDVKTWLLECFHILSTVLLFPSSITLY